MHRAAKAYARKQQWDVVPHSAIAASLLGLSQQVPAKLVYLTSGPTKTIRIGTRDLAFRNARPKAFAARSGLVIQALRFLGKSRVDADVRQRLGSVTSEGELNKVLRHTQYAATWIHEVVRRIAEERPGAEQQWLGRRCGKTCSPRRPAGWGA